jgi:hypothetical protein
MRAKHGIWAVAVGLSIAMFAACGGRIEQADCGPNATLCSAALVCCPNPYVCGTGDNDCPIGGCCLPDTSAPAPQTVTLPPPSVGNGTSSGSASSTHGGGGGGPSAPGKTK